RHGAAGGVSHVALISSVVPYMLQADDNPEGVPQGTFDEITEGLIEDRAKFFTSFFKDFYGVSWVARPVSEEVLRHSWGMAMQAGLRPTLAAAEAFATTDFRPDLASFTMPTLVVHGTADKTVPIDATARAVARAVPQAQLIEYEGEAHGVLATQTDRLIGDLIAFLEGTRTEREPVPQDVLDAVTAGTFAATPL
ncbi:MAG: alpha/beta hydrolase, partial [Novosphingobium sp.]